MLDKFLNFISTIKIKIDNSLRKTDKLSKLAIKTFFMVLFVVFLLGLIIFARPKKSVIEKRNLSKFPSFSISSFLNGDFTSEVSTWYADTFPFRDSFIKLNNNVKSLFGFGSEEVIGNVETSDDINTAKKKKSNLKKEKVDLNRDKGEKIGALYVVDGSAFELYGFPSQASTNYVAMINEVTEKLDGQSTVYSILVPNSTGVMLSEKKQQEIGSDSQKDAINFIKNSYNKKVKFVPLIDTLIKHNNEYLYFRSDHHWTADGAYYAYKNLMKIKGEKACSLKDYTKKKYKGFLGTFYAYSNQNEDMAKKPDTVNAYIPQVNTMKIQNKLSDEPMDYSIIYDGNSLDATNKYLTFIGGDNALSVITNDEVKDTNKSCLVIKESYGNCFVPFLVNSYNTVYVVDYRYYSDNLTDFVYNNDIKDVIFINNVGQVIDSNVQSIYNLW